MQLNELYCNLYYRFSQVRLNDIRTNNATLSTVIAVYHLCLYVIVGDYNCANIDVKLKRETEKEGINTTGKDRKSEIEKANKLVGQSITGIDLGGKCSHDQPTWNMSDVRIDFVERAQSVVVLHSLPLSPFSMVRSLPPCILQCRWHARSLEGVGRQRDGRGGEGEQSVIFPSSALVKYFLRRLAFASHGSDITTAGNSREGGGKGKK